MPMTLDATFQNTNAINLDAFRSAPGAEGFADKTIRVGNHRYSVSFADDGKVSVSFAATSFFHLFQGSAKTEVRDKIQELVDTLSLKRDLGKVVSLTSQQENVDAVMRSEAESISGKLGGRIAHYGFSSVRESGARVISSLAEERQAQNKAPICHQLINDYNVSLELDEWTTAARTIIFVRDLNLDQWTRGKQTTIPPEDVAAWRDFLKGHDIDLFSKIRLARTQAAEGKPTGWAGEIARNGLENAVRDMIRKNIDPRVAQGTPDLNFVLTGVAQAVIEAVDTDFSMMNEAQIKAALKEIVERHAPRGKGEMAFKIFNEAAVSAFWRQTSKLGLDFFKARGETVVFEWTKYNGEATDETELDNKWWKSGNEDVRSHAGVAITNSEMRHLESTKYARKTGPGEVIRVAGGLDQERAEQLVQDKIDTLSSLSKKELASLRADLEADFKTRAAEDFETTAWKFLVSNPDLNGVRINWVSKDGIFSNDGEAAVANAFARLQARIENTHSPLVRTAMLANLETLFSAELLKDPEIQELFESGPSASVDPHAENARRLAGLDRGRGAQAFFLPDSGLPNNLGSLLLREADQHGSDVATLAEEVVTAFAQTFGCAKDGALAHPAFKSFLVRAAALGSMERLLGALPAVKAAYDAKTALANDIAALDLSDFGKSVFARRGDWDLDRLVYNEVVAAGAEKRSVNMKTLRGHVAMIGKICNAAISFADEVEQRLGTAFSIDEKNRLVDAYLDREGSAVRSYRLTGRGDDNGLDVEHKRVLDQARTLADAVRTGVGELPPAVRTSILTSAISSHAKLPHLTVALPALKALRAGGAVPYNQGRTPTECLTGFARAFADRIRDIVTARMAVLAEAAKQEFGYDDENTILSMIFNGYLAEHADFADYLDTALTEKVINDLGEIDGADGTGNPLLPHVLDMIRTHGRL